MFVSVIVTSTVQILIAGLVFWAVYVVLGRRHLLRPDIGKILRDTHLLTDLCHYIGNKLIFIPLWIVFVALLLGGSGQDGGQQSAIGTAIAGLPWIVQLLLSLLLFDLTAYWRHRLMHTALLWPFHAVHHSSLHLNWLSGTRNHPINTLTIYLCGALLLAAFGIGQDVIAVTAVARFYWVCFIHSDIRFDLGPLNYVLTTPDFHRWHHVTDDIRNRNFAGFFSLIDLVFGTFYLPSGRRAETFGVGEDNYPNDYVGQLIAPFRRLRLPGW